MKTSCDDCGETWRWWLVGSLLLTAVALALGACVPGGAATGAPVYQLLRPDDSTALLRERAGGSDFTILDVRTPGEFAEGHLYGAVVLDVNAGGFREKLVAYDREAPYLVYCRSGVRSRTATKVMQEMGFSEVYEVGGGIKAWIAADLPVVR